MSAITEHVGGLGLAFAIRAAIGAIGPGRAQATRVSTFLAFRVHTLLRLSAGELLRGVVVVFFPLAHARGSLLCSLGEVMTTAEACAT